MSDALEQYMPRLTVEKLFDDAILPKRATEWSAGYDLHAYINDRSIPIWEGHRIIGVAQPALALTLAPGWRAVVPVGFSAQMAPMYEAQVRPRSGRSIKTCLRIPNAPGTIDADFPNEWAVLVENTSATESEVIRHGEAIAQVVFHRYEVLEIVPGTVGVVTDRVGGYGSTDKR